MKTLLTSLFILFFSINVCANAVEKITIGEKLSLHSNILNEDREYWVYLPEGYTNDKKYPVVYILDGNYHFHTASGVFKHMSESGLLPEMILVAILNTDRTRDLTPTFSQLTSKGTIEDFYPTSGGSKHFLAFLKNELIPTIASQYSTQKHNMLIGHSFGALFSLYALIEEPGLFQSIISIDPSLWWDHDWLTKELVKKIANKPTPYTSLYIAAANNPDRVGFPKRGMIGPQEAFFKEISQWNSSNFDAKFKYFANESHGTVPLIALFEGLSSIFKDYQLPVERFIEDPSLLVKHYEAWSHKLGYQVNPPENLVNNIGYELLWQGKINASIELFKLNVINYPLSANVYDSLGEAYLANKQHNLSIENYKKVLQIDKNHEGAKAQLKKLHAGK